MNADGCPPFVVDTREQPHTAWTFDGPTVRGTLATGDYSLVGFENRVALARKTLPDLVACCTGERDRFWRELERLGPFDFRAVVVEADMGSALCGLYVSRARPWSIVTSTLAIVADFGIPVLWAGDRKTAARVGAWLLRRAWCRLSAGAATEAA